MLLQKVTNKLDDMKEELSRTKENRGDYDAWQQEKCEYDYGRAHTGPRDCWLRKDV